MRHEKPVIAMPKAPIFIGGGGGGGGQEDPGSNRLASLILIPGKVMEQIILESISKHMKDKKIYEGKIMPDQPDVYLDFSKTFNTVSYNLLIDKLMKYRLDKCMLRWTENWLNCRAQRVRPVTSGVPKVSILGPKLFNMLINDLGDGVERTFSKFGEDTKLGGVVDMPEGHAVIQRDLDRLEKWADRNLMKFSNDKYKVLHLGRNNPMHQYLLGADQLESSLAEKVLQRRPTASWAALGEALPADREVIFPIYSALVRPHLEYCVHFRAPQYNRDIVADGVSVHFTRDKGRGRGKHTVTDMDIWERVQRKATKMIEGLEHLSYEERLRQLGLFSLEKRMLKGILSMCTNV
ncbi:hypothetical protein QYF61_023325 [Mycteria americana]|uniref:Reverse transcriptase domain-containing protein n=1 Tax=Mycteria americana TaxID=33587 RepID=A0AAN7MKE4_MYCAM|nr:hypothetical protein QYF61_023325 [Mycteria americana]